ncbi:hypothetical protein ACLBYG_21995 [Methylobacterium sp. D53M]
MAPWSNRDHVDAVFSRMMKGFELGHGMSEADRQVRNGEYIDAVKGLPLSAVIGAAERFRSGETLTAWKKDKRPTSAQFADEAKAGLVPARAKLVKLRHVLDAEIYEQPSEDARRKVGEAMEAFLRGRKPPQEPGRPVPSEAEVSAAQVAALREHGARLTRSASGGGLDHLMARLPPAPEEAAARQEREARA